MGRSCRGGWANTVELDPAAMFCVGEAKQEQEMTDIEQALEVLIERIVERVLERKLAALHATPPAPLLTVAQTADRLGVSVSSIRLYIRVGRLPITRVGRSIRIAADAQVAPRVAPPADSAATMRAAQAWRKL
jgi:excisionase family DNA binding protein